MKRFTLLLLFTATVVAVVGCSTWLVQKKAPASQQPATAKGSADKATNEIESSLKEHVEHLAVKIGERNLKRIGKLNEAADYIEEQLKSYGFSPQRQAFKVRGLECFNIEAEIKGTTRPDEILIVGAHYDSAEGTPGANDNGSGTAAMLVLAKHFSRSKFDRTLRFVAFTNEEPPYFQNQGEMGSWVYAEKCRKEDQNIIGVISLETMGYYTDKANSQNYPSPLDRLYPSTGNFVGFVANLGSGKMQRQVLKSFKSGCDVPAEGAALPGNLPGVGWSDHWSFWQEGYKGIMVTDTAPYRYPHYHKATDLPKEMNFPVFAKVVEGLKKPIVMLLEPETKKSKNK